MRKICILQSWSSHTNFVLYNNENNTTHHNTNTLESVMFLSITLIFFSSSCLFCAMCMFIYLLYLTHVNTFWTRSWFLIKIMLWECKSTYCTAIHLNVVRLVRILFHVVLWVRWEIGHPEAESADMCSSEETLQCSTCSDRPFINSPEQKWSCVCRIYRRDV